MIVASLRKTSRGSVLLIVVVLLVLLAIMGTAYLTTTRAHLINASLDQANKQTDAYVQTAEEIAKSYAIQVLFNKNNPPTAPGFRTIDMVGQTFPDSQYVIPCYGGYSNVPKVDQYLADRLPINENDFPQVFQSPTSPPVWAAITAPLIANSTQQFQFESPDNFATSATPAPGAVIQAWQPTFKTVGGVTYPALIPIAGAPGTTGSPGTAFIAASAAGDGIADSGLVRIPGASADGVTYYMALRIIDNNSAINVNTAWDENADYDFTGTKISPTVPPTAPTAYFPLGTFPSQVGLQEVLNPSTSATEIANLSGYRFPGLATTAQTALDDAGIAHDVQFASLGDAMAQMVASRVNNPGNFSTSGGVNTRYGTISESDGASLAYGFCLRNLNGNSITTNPAPQTVIENLLYNGNPNSTNEPVWASTIPTAPYSPSDIANWYNNFPGSPTYNNNARPLLVTRNGVSNQAPAFSADSTALNVPVPDMLPYGDRGRWQQNLQYYPGDVVTWSDTGGDPLYYVCINPTPSPSTAPANPASDATDWIVPNPTTPAQIYSAATAYQPWSSSNANFFFYYAPSQQNGGASFSGMYRLYEVLSATTAGDTPETKPWEFAPISARGIAVTSTSSGTPSLTTSTIVPKANINTASFPELYRAFWNVFSTYNATLASSAWSSLPTPFDTGTTPPTPPPTPKTLSPVDPQTPPAPPPPPPPPLIFAGIYTGNHFSTTQPTALPVVPKAESSEAPVDPANPGDTNTYRMVRSAIRDCRPLSAVQGMMFVPYQMVLLRSAIAAANAESLRRDLSGSSMMDVIARPIRLMLQNDGPTFMPVTVTVYGATPQPYIVEVFAQTDTGVATYNGKNYQNAKGYFAIVLYNPYSFDMSLVSTQINGADACWALGFVDRSQQNKNFASVQPVLFDATDFPLPVGATVVNGVATLPNPLVVPTRGIPVIPKQGYLVLENFQDGGGGDAEYRPPSTGLGAAGLTGTIPNSNPTAEPAQGAIYKLYVPNLDHAIGHELILLRRRLASGAVTKTTVTTPSGSVSVDDSVPVTTPNNLMDFVPVDSFDFDGLIMDGNTADVWHYARGNSATTTPSLAWDFVYPGRFDGTQSQGATATNGLGRQQGTYDGGQWALPSNGTLGHQDPWCSNAATCAYGGPAAPYQPVFGQSSYLAATYTPNFPIQIANVLQPVRGNRLAASANVFPFGGFARDGDILQVPFIGAYMIQDPSKPRTTAMIDLNSITMDAAMAEDTDTGDDVDQSGNPLECVGRFCPIIHNPPSTSDLSASTLDVFDDTQRSVSSGKDIRYGWANSLFDFLTTRSPRNDYLPNVNPDWYNSQVPANYVEGVWPMPVSNQVPPGYPITTSTSSPETLWTPPAGTPASTANANTEFEDTASVEGKINVNTASWQVLAALPLVIDKTTNIVDTTGLNTSLAKAIVADRIQNGPFRSLFDLNRVIDSGANGFQNAEGTINLDAAATITNFTLPQGNLSPSDSVQADFAARYAQVTRLSNILTTRSDVFTVYGVVEGWINAGSSDPTKPPKLVVQRHFAFILDRNSVTPANRTVQTLEIPNN